MVDQTPKHLALFINHMAACMHIAAQTWTKHAAGPIQPCSKQLLRFSCWIFGTIWHPRTSSTSGLLAKRDLEAHSRMYVPCAAYICISITIPSALLHQHNNIISIVSSALCRLVAGPASSIHHCLLCMFAYMLDKLSHLAYLY